MTKPATILVVDDDARNVKLLETVLGAEGHAVLTAGGGAEALRVAAATLPDLIVLDIMMPDMNGFDVAERLKENPATRDIPILMLTALDDRESQRYALQMGAADFLCKPVKREALMARVEKLLPRQEG